MSEVILAGAGCGPAEQCTLEVLQAIEKADIIFYDDLLDVRLLDRNQDAEKVYTGKRQDRPSVSQQEIIQRLLEAAGKYERVLRLKGGDPFVFGRGYEEKLALEAAGIDCRVLPGLSSCIVVPQRCGIPVTARNVSSSFLVTTAHTREHGLFDQSASLLAQYSGTLVILMGVSRLQAISETLIAAGKDPRTPAAICLSADIISSRCIRTTLQDLPEAGSGCRGIPGVLVIGAAAGLSEPVLPDKITFRTGICATADFAASVQKELRGSNIELVPVLELEVIPEPDPFDRQDLEQADWLVFTSAHGTRLFLEELRRQKIDLRTLSKSKIACIGRKTAQPLEEAGLYPDLLPDHPETRCLFSALAGEVRPDDSVLIFRCGQAGKEEEVLEGRCHLRRKNLYSLEPRFRNTPEGLGAIAFGSAFAVKSFYEQYPGCPAMPLCIGPVCFQEASRLAPVPPQQAEKISAASLAALIREQ